jgi:hypothetical protein
MPGSLGFIRCTITMSVHQYHVLDSICPNKKPALHRSES